MQSISSGASSLLGLALIVCTPAAAAPCAERVDRLTVVTCAINASLDLAAASTDASGARARLSAASVLLPSNPNVGFSLGRRSSNVDEGVNWSASLSQAIEIGGQRSARRQAVEKEIRSSAASVERARQTAAAAGLVAYFDAVSADELLQLAERLASVADVLTRVAEGRASEGISAPIEAAVAYAAGVQLLRLRGEAQALAAARRSALAVVLGLDPAAHLTLDADLSPLPIEARDASALAAQAEAQHPELLALSAQLEAARARVGVLERERIPSLTLSAFVQRDGFDEVYWGGGLALPVPLPAPIGRTNAGEIAEATALVGRADFALRQRRRQIQLEIVQRSRELETRKAALALYSPRRLEDAEGLLRALAEELGTGRLAPRDALASEQALLELLRSYVDARREVAVASVELALVAGRDFEGGMK